MYGESRTVYYVKPCPSSRNKSAYTIARAVKRLGGRLKFYYRAHKKNLRIAIIFYRVKNHYDLPDSTIDVPGWGRKRRCRCVRLASESLVFLCAYESGGNFRDSLFYRGFIFLFF